MRIIFMGTPDFAVPSLDSLVQAGYDIVGVITATDKPGGRRGLMESAVKKYALEKGLHIMQPKNLKAPEFVEHLRSLKADLQIVVAFRMLPEIVWDMPPLGTMNLHGSLLPKYRGAAPINWAVMNGETETGATTFLLKHQIDTGDLLYQEKMPIGPNDTAGDIHHRMMHLGARLVLKSVQALENQSVEAIPQTGEITHAPKIFTETCELDFSKSAAELHNFVRGLSPFPTAWTMLDGKKFKIYKTIILDPNEPATEPDGTLLQDGKDGLKYATAKGYLNLLEVQLEGKRRMEIKDFLNGWNGGGLEV